MSHIGHVTETTMNEHGELLVEIIPNGPFVENCYLLVERATRRALLIDPGDEEQRILARIRELNLDVLEIVNTHAHIDHAGGVAPLKRLLGVGFALHPGEREWLERLPLQAAMFGIGDKEVPEVDRELADGQSVQLGELTARVLHTPGHSPGGCCLYFAEQKVVIVGDTLFSGSIGRTDLPGGDMATLLASIRDKLFVLDDDVVVYNGHGPSTTIGAERRTNPFLQQL